jgi:hypothetical protein
LHFLQPEKYDFHTYRKRSYLCEINFWLYSLDFKKEFFRQISILQVPAGSKKIERILKIFYFHNNMVGLEPNLAISCCGMTPVWLHAKN